MAKSARRRREPDPWESPTRAAAASVAGLVARNPTLVGGSTAFLVALTFVSANALWYQPHVHSSAFFATRAFPEAARFAEPEPDGTTIVIERPPEEAAAPAPERLRPAGDPRVEQVQGILKALNFYAGEVDGLTGPATRKAIEAYQAKMALPVTGVADDALLAMLGADQTTAGIPEPRPAVADAQPANDERIRRIQGGLRAFGNEAIEIDGVIGTRTRGAIREFQALFGLPETGEPDEAVYAKMREIGLTN